MDTIGAIFKQTSWQILGKVVTSISTFIILGFVARNYKEEGTGIFTLALLYISIFTMLSDFGLNAHVLRKVTGYRRLPKGKVTVEWNKLLGTRLLWSGVLVVLALWTLPLWPFANPEFSEAVVFGSLAILGSAIFVTCNLIFQAKLRYDLSILASSLGTVLGLVVYIYLSARHFPTSLLLIANSITWTAVALFSLLLVKRFSQTLIPLFSFEYSKKLFKESWPIAATLALNVVYFRADSFLIAYFKGIADVGIYNLAFSVFQSALVLPTFIMNSYYPLMLKSQEKIKQVGIGLIVLAIVGTVLTLILAKWLINILTGGSFAGSVASLQILSLGFPAYFLSALFMWLLVVRGKYKTMLIIYSVGLLINMILNLYFIPNYSFFASSWITVICEYIILLMQIWVLRGILHK